MMLPRNSAAKGRSRGLRTIVWLALCLGVCSCARLESFRQPASPPSPDRANDPNYSPNSRYPANDFDNDSGRIVGQREGSRVRTLLASASRVIHRRSSSPASESPAGELPADKPAAGRDRIAEDGSPVTVSLQPPQPVAGASAAPAPAATARAADEERVAITTPRSAQPDATERVAAEPNPRANRTSRAQAKKAAKTASRPAGPDPAALVRAAHAKLATIGSYQVDLTRQERVNGALQPAETVLLSVRRSPQAVRLDWPSGPHKGREVIYAADAEGGMMHVNMADSVVPVPRLTMRPDSPMALANSRHPINEAGFETVLASLESSVTQPQGPDPSAGRAVYEGLEQVPSLGQACHKFRQSKPNGETWLVYLDARTQMPALVEATASSGELLERYEFRNLAMDPPALASASAFNPEARWGPAPSLFRKLAKAAGAGAQPSGTLPQ